jgi:hypothetical protein
MIFFLVLSVIVNLSLGFVVYNLVQKVENYEDYCANILAQTKSILTQMRAIDIRGSFEADDEVGIIFKSLFGLIETLERFVPENANDE